jgi:hypothetical protein
MRPFLALQFNITQDVTAASDFRMPESFRQRILAFTPAALIAFLSGFRPSKCANSGVRITTITAVVAVLDMNFEKGAVIMIIPRSTILGCVPNGSKKTLTVCFAPCDHDDRTLLGSERTMHHFLWDHTKSITPVSFALTFILTVKHIVQLGVPV